jgi:hypothetical protein
MLVDVAVYIPHVFLARDEIPKGENGVQKDGSRCINNSEYS